MGELSLFDVEAEVAPVPAPPRPRPSTCRCIGKHGGFSNRGTATQQWWVHTACGLVTRDYLRAMRPELFA